MVTPSSDVANRQQEFFGEPLTKPPQPHDLSSLSEAIADIGFVRVKALRILEADARISRGEDATPDPEDIRRNTGLIFLVDPRPEPPPRLYRLASNLLVARANLDVSYSTTFDVSETADSPAGQKPPSARIRYYHDIDPDTYDELLSGMIEAWQSLGCLSIISCKKPIKEAVTDPTTLKGVEEDRVFETIMPTYRRLNLAHRHN